MDSICDLFEPPMSPRPRSPAARADKLALFDELSDEALKTYSPAQLSTILNQRARVNYPSIFRLPQLTIFRYSKSPERNLKPAQQANPPTITAKAFSRLSKEPKHRLLPCIKLAYP